MTSITPTSETDSPNGWRALRPHCVTAAIVLLSLFVHGLQASALGLYWDDAGQLLQGLLAADHEPLAFILSDTGGSLRSERPLAYLAFGITRAAFLHGVAAVHWVLVALLTLNAVAIAGVARRLVDEDWFALAAAAVFLCYPLAPLQPLWAATVHYHVACLLALTCIVCIDRDLTGSGARRRGWSVVGFGVYAGSLATHEGFALVPPAFFVARWLCTLRPIADPGGRAHADERRPIAARLLGFAAVLALFAVWRVAFLPADGLQLYPFRPERLAADVLLPKLAKGVVAAALPWGNAVKYLLRSPAAGPWLLAAGGAAAIVSVASVVLIRRTTRTPHLAARRTGAADDHRWWCALASGASMLVAGVIAVSLSPIAIELVFGTIYGSRGNFVATPGIAIALPALFAAGLGFPSRRSAVTARHLVLSAALACLVFVGSLVHFTVKQEFVSEWEEHKAKLTALGALAPRIADSSLVIILDQRDRRAPYADHYEMSVYLLALYDNWSLLGNTTRHVRFHHDGVESTYHGTPGEWFAPGDKGVLATATLQPVGRIGYDRVLLFSNDHGLLRAVADTVVTAEDGSTLRVRSNAGRIRAGPPPSTRAWHHVTR